MTAAAATAASAGAVVTTGGSAGVGLGFLGDAVATTGFTALYGVGVGLGLATVTGVGWQLWWFAGDTRAGRVGTALTPTHLALRARAHFCALRMAHDSATAA